MSEREQRVPIIEERVRVDKRLIDSGVVKISTSVGERTEMVTAALMHEEVDIKRVPMEVEIDRVPDVRREGELLIIPVVEERAVLHKRLVLVGEVHVRRRVLHEEREISVDVRTTQVHVQRESLTSDSEETQASTGETK